VLNVKVKNKVKNTKLNAEDTFQIWVTRLGFHIKKREIENSSCRVNHCIAHIWANCVPVTELVNAELIGDLKCHHRK